MYYAIATALGVQLAVVLGAGTASLHIGKVRVEDSEYVVSVMLEASEHQVAAADFRLRYDPLVVAPERVVVGDSARQADKAVTANVTAPGEYVIVVMGLNRNTIPDGELAQVVFRAIGAPGSRESELVIAEATLATWEGMELPVEVQGARIRLERQFAQKNERVEMSAAEATFAIRINDEDNKEKDPAGVSGAADNKPSQSGHTIIESTIAEAGGTENRTLPEPIGAKQRRVVSRATLFAGLAVIVVGLGVLILRRRLRG